ncbi:hypothetical protein POM88_015535 [Heracleum sosnowskyi]|uniref:Uncharacterized protein n=1 Tax=Heracleum sosnowskyi TaxID=360622 RepID=A0AAD8IN32_9APIA|nr:hypothetical protein POM88_015535 [Heracleum sosnowskyi]
MPNLEYEVNVTLVYDALNIENKEGGVLLLALRVIHQILGDYQEDSLSKEANAVFDKSSEDKDAKHDLVEDIDASPEEAISSDQVPTLTVQETFPINSASVKLSSNSEAATSTELHEPSQSRSSTSALKSYDYSPTKGLKASIIPGDNELSKFSGSPGDASLED